MENDERNLLTSSPEKNCNDTLNVARFAPSITEQEIDLLLGDSDEHDPESQQSESGNNDLLLSPKSDFEKDLDDITLDLSITNQEIDQFLKDLEDDESNDNLDCAENSEDASVIDCISSSEKSNTTSPKKVTISDISEKVVGNAEICADSEKSNNENPNSDIIPLGGPEDELVIVEPLSRNQIFDSESSLSPGYSITSEIGNILISESDNDSEMIDTQDNEVIVGADKHHKRNEETENIHISQKRRRSINNCSPEIAMQFKKARQESEEENGNEEASNATFSSFSEIQTDGEIRCQNFIKSFTKLLSSTKFPQICPYNSIKDIDEKIPVKSNSDLAFLFPINVVLDRKITSPKQIPWNLNTIKLPSDFTNIEDKLLVEFDEELVKIPSIPPLPPQPLTIPEELMPKTEFEKNYWKNVMPRIGPTFVIQTGMGRTEKESWLKMKEIDDKNGIEWTPMDIGYDIISNNTVQQNL